MQTTPLITNTSVGYIQHMTFVVCPSYVDTSLLVNANGPCNDIQWLCYYGDGLGGWSNGGGVCRLPDYLCNKFFEHLSIHRHTLFPRM